MTDEQRVFAELEQKPYRVQLGGKSVRLLPSNLSDDQYMASIISEFKALHESSVLTADDIMSLMDGKKLAKIISRTAKSNARVYPYRVLSTWIRRKRAFYLAYNKASKFELTVVISPLISSMRVFFYRNCIISLKGQNGIKPTRETVQTAHGV